MSQNFKEMINEVLTKNKDIIYNENEEQLYCLSCSYTFNKNKKYMKYRVKEHLATQKHIKGLSAPILNYEDMTFITSNIQLNLPKPISTPSIPLLSNNCKIVSENVLKDIISQYHEIILIEDSTKLFCSVCSINMNMNPKYVRRRVKEHVFSQKHKSKLNQGIQEPVSPDIVDSSENLFILSLTKEVFDKIQFFKNTQGFSSKTYNDFVSHILDIYQDTICQRNTPLTPKQHQINDDDLMKNQPIKIESWENSFINCNDEDNIVCDLLDNSLSSKEIGERVDVLIKSKYYNLPNFLRRLPNESINLFPNAEICSTASTVFQKYNETVNEYEQAGKMDLIPSGENNEELSLDIFGQFENINFPELKTLNNKRQISEELSNDCELNHKKAKSHSLDIFSYRQELISDNIKKENE